MVSVLGPQITRLVLTDD